MITSPAFSGRRYAVLGLARSGLAAAEALLASGAEVIAWDRQDVARDKLAGRATLADPMETDLTGFAGVVVSPGVPLNTHPIVGHAAPALARRRSLLRLEGETWPARALCDAAAGLRRGPPCPTPAP